MHLYCSKLVYVKIREAGSESLQATASRIYIFGLQIEACRSRQTSLPPSKDQTDPYPI